jgi:hypothetical protein
MNIWLYILISLGVLVGAVLAWPKSRQWLLRQISQGLTHIGQFVSRKWKDVLFPLLIYVGQFVSRKWKDVLFPSLIVTLTIVLWFVPVQVDFGFLPSRMVLSWIGAISALILGLLGLLYYAFFKISCKHYLEGALHKTSGKFAKAILVASLLLLFIGTGWIILILFGGSIVTSVEERSGKFTIPWLPVGIIVGVIIVVLLLSLFRGWFLLFSLHLRRSKYLMTAMGIALSLALLHVAVWAFFSDFWEAWYGYPVLFWITNAGIATVLFLAISGIPGGKWLTVPLAVIVIGGTYYHFTQTPAAEKASQIMREIDLNLKSALPDKSEPEPIAVGTISWVMPEGVEGKYRKERSSVNRVEIIQLDEEVFHYVTFCRHTGRELTTCIWNRKTSKRGKWRTVDFNHGNEVREGDWYLVQSPDNPLIFEGAWSSPVSSGGNDVPYRLVIDPQPSNHSR